MRFLGFISLLLLLSSCTTSYHFKKDPETAGATEAYILQPLFQKQLYRCEVNGYFLFRKFHLSGLLYFKNLSDTATRVVFQNELGITYFDFGWNKKDSFQVFHIMEQMNKPALIKTLQKDFEIVLGKKISKNVVSQKSKTNQEYISRHAFYKGFVYYYWSKGKPDACFQIDYGTVKRPLVRFAFKPAALQNQAGLPDSMSIRHYRAGFSIQLKKIPNE
jgi:hypothetical protein